VIYASWWGGSSYSVGEIYPDADGHSDVEIFFSVTAAKHALRGRYRYGSWERQDVYYADGRHERTLFPAVGEDSEMFIYFYDPREASDPYPDRRLYFGARQGVREERC